MILMPPPDASVLARRGEIVEALRRIVPGEGVVESETGRRAFECDALTAYRQMPMVVVLPETTAQVAEVLRYCSANKIKVVPRGAGTSLSGGALPLEELAAAAGTLGYEILTGIGARVRRVYTGALATA